MSTPLRSIRLWQEAAPARRPAPAVPWGLLVVGGATLVALVSARPYAGGWNDGSRLAMVESLAERSTFRIDDSVYARPTPPGGPHPFDPTIPLLTDHGTKDKIRVGGHFYSDKSPVPGVLMAGAWKVGRAVGLPAPADRPDLFARLLAWLFAGVPYVFAVACVLRIARNVGLAPGPAAVVGLAFAASAAAPYAASVNTHILIAAAAAGAFAVMTLPGRPTAGRAALLGTAAGFAYTTDVGTGPAVLLALGGWAAWATRDAPFRRLSVFALAALPWIGLHHVLNFQIGGTFGPANANPAYFEWPGSPFGPDTMTGGWKHASAGKLLLYAADMLVGKKGFLLHTPALVFGLVAFVPLVRRPHPHRPALLAGGVFALGTWVTYALASNNQSGACCTVRWFLPLLVPGLLAAAVGLRKWPALRTDFAVLVCGGAILAAGFVVRGPWWGKLMPGYWPVVGLTFIAWGGLVVGRWYAARRARAARPAPGVFAVPGPEPPLGAMSDERPRGVA